MKVNKIKAKVAAKVAKGKAKIASKCGKAAKCAAILFALAALATGCATAEAPTAQRAQNVKAENVRVTYNITVNAPVPAASNATEKVVAKADSPAPVNFTFTTEVGTATQANETSGTETMTNTPTQTPTNDVKPQTTLTYGLCSGTAAGSDWIKDLTAESAKGLATWLKSGDANGTMVVTKENGQTEKVTCVNGVCTNQNGDRITCSMGDCPDGNCSM